MTAITPIIPAAQRHLREAPTLGQALSDARVMARRGLIKIRRTPEQLFDVTVQPILFTLMFTYVFGGAIAGSIDAYLPIVIPGILVQTVITTSVVTGVQLREDMEKGVFDRFRSLPIARIAPLFGALLADVVRYTIATTLTLIMGVVLGYTNVTAHWPYAVGAGLLVIVVSWSVSWIFAFFGMIARTASSVQGISMIVLFPLTFISNAFVPTTNMPDWMRWFAETNPISHLVTATRSLLNDTAITSDVWITLASAAIIVAIFAPLTLRAYNRKV